MTTMTPRPMQPVDLAGALRKAPRKPATANVTHDNPDSATPEERQQAVETPTASSDTPAPVMEPVHPRSRQAADGRSIRAIEPAQITPAPALPRRTYRRLITLNLPRSTHERIATTAAQRKMTSTALILTAISRTHQDLAGQLGDDGHVEAGELFEIPQAQPPGEASVQTSIRVTDQQLAAIQRLVIDTGVTRSRVIVKAVELYLA